MMAPADRKLADVLERYARLRRVFAREMEYRLGRGESAPDAVSGKSLWEGVARKSSALEHVARLGAFIFVPNPGNLGDALIAEAEYQQFHARQLDFEIYDSAASRPWPESPYNLVMGGGGRFVEYWTYHRAFDIFKDKKFKEVVILPSSFWRCDDFLELLDERATVYCRDRRSCEYCQSRNRRARFLVDHDMAFSLDPSFCRSPNFCESSMTMPAEMDAEMIMTVYDKGYAPWVKIRENISKCLASFSPPPPGDVRIGYFLRGDAEKSDFEIDKPALDIAVCGINTCVRRSLVRFLAGIYLSAVNCFDIVVTDRLHAGIAAGFLGKNVIYLDNSYGKVSGCHDLSMRGIQGVCFVSDPSGLDRAIQQSADALRCSPGNRQRLGVREISFLEFAQGWLSLEGTVKTYQR